MPKEIPPFYIVDTNVLSNPGDLRDENVVEWMRRNGTRICVSVITVTEMRRGLIMLQQKLARTTDQKVARRDRERLERKVAWYNKVVNQFSLRIVPIDLPVAERWADISVKFPSVKDGDRIIAATALAKGYGVVTENMGDFKAVGIPAIAVVNPFDPNTWNYDEADPIDAVTPPKM
jgi:predicted nucleic acid-binding protein